jgi:hypothetical protein
MCGRPPRVATSIGDMEVLHDLPPDVLIGVVHWLQAGGHNTVDQLNAFRSMALEGGQYCRNDGCEAVGHLKEFKVCPAVQDRPVLQRCVSETGLDYGWAQGNVWHCRI